MGKTFVDVRFTRTVSFKKRTHDETKIIGSSVINFLEPFLYNDQINKDCIVALCDLKLKTVENRIKTTETSPRFYVTTNYTGHLTYSMIEKNEHRQIKPRIDFGFIKPSLPKYSSSSLVQWKKIQDADGNLNFRFVKKATKLRKNFKVYFHPTNKNDFNSFKVEVWFRLHFAYGKHAWIPRQRLFSESDVKEKMRRLKQQGHFKGKPREYKLLLLKDIRAMLSVKIFSNGSQITCEKPCPFNDTTTHFY